jgi:hypothetical protein
VIHVDSWRAEGGMDLALTEDTKWDGRDGWWRLRYDILHGRFDYPHVSEYKPEGLGKCVTCKADQVEMQKEEVKVDETGSRIRISNVWYHVGQFIYLEDNSLQYKIEKKPQQVYPKENKDPKVYPEYWRKPAAYKGDHHDTWDPFQIVRLEEILRTDDGPVLRLRKMYRADDTHMADKDARSAAYTCIFWTEEIVRMYLPEEGQRLARPGMDIIAGQAWVTAQSGGDTASLEEWTDVGEDRFFVTKVYDSDNRTFAKTSCS